MDNKITEEQLESERKHYFELGKWHGRDQFNWSHFITYFGAGLSAGLLIGLLFKMIS